MTNTPEEFKAKFPYLELVKRGDNDYQVYFSNTRTGSSSMYTSFPVPESTEVWFVKENMENKVQYEFMEKYPYLYPYIDEDLRIRSLWINRDGDGREAVPKPQNEKTWVYTEEEFDRYNEEGRKANQPDWFFCTRCGRAKPNSEYSYFHFAASVCKDCKEKDPASYERAMRENYD